MNQLTEYEYTIPAYMVCAIAYGDYDGLSKSDERALDEFINSLPKGNNTLSFGTQSEFTYTNDILGSVGCDCVQVTLTIFDDDEIEEDSEECTD